MRLPWATETAPPPAGRTVYDGLVVGGRDDCDHPYRQNMPDVSRFDTAASRTYASECVECGRRWIHSWREVPS